MCCCMRQGRSSELRPDIVRVQHICIGPHTTAEHPRPWCRGWCELLCGRGCGFCMGPLKRYQEAFSSGRYIPTLQVSNYMNQEAIVQVMLLSTHALQIFRYRAILSPM